jgi:hypothetical protein
MDAFKGKFQLALLIIFLLIFLFVFLVTKAARSIKNEHISVLRGILLINPPQAESIQYVLDALNIMFGQAPTRQNALELLGRENFKDLLINYDVFNMSDDTLIQLKPIVSNIDFRPENIVDVNNIRIININCQKICQYVLDVYDCAIKLRKTKLLKIFASLLGKKEISIVDYMENIQKLHKYQQKRQLFNLDESNNCYKILA